MKRDKYGRSYVGGYGPAEADVMICAEAPGYEEDRRGRPLIGKTGSETQRLCYASGISFRHCYLTNIVKYRPLTNKTTGNSSPTAEDIARDEGDLIAEIGSVRPEWIIAVGRIAARWFMEEDVDLEDVEGFAWPHLPRAQGATVIVVRHPAAGFHSPEQQPAIFWGFQRAGQYINGSLEVCVPVDEFPEPDYQLWDSSDPMPEDELVAVDTEGLYGSAWCLTYSSAPGSARMIKHDNPDGLEWFEQMMERNTLLLHNAPHDLRILAELLKMDTVELMSRIRFEDSMQAAYCLRLMPKGLKSLGKKFLGVNMRSYRSVVAEADGQIMERWLKDVLLNRCAECDGLGEVIVRPVSEKTGKLLTERPVKCEECDGDGTAWQPPSPQLVVNKDGKMRISQGWGMGRRVRSILKAKSKYEENDEGNPVDLRQRWEQLKKKDYEFADQVEKNLGNPREVTLSDVEFETALEYACRDADVTKRIWPIIKDEMDRQTSEKVLRALELGTSTPGTIQRVYEQDLGVIPMITRMMECGWRIDCKRLRRLGNKLEIQQDKLLYRIEKLAGKSVNPNSSQQVAEVLFRDLGLPQIKETETGAPSTDNTVLSDLRSMCVEQRGYAAANSRSAEQADKGYQIISAILDYRERDKLKSTYTDSLPKLVDDESRLHTQIKLATVESGRLASANPNLQNIPARTALGKRIRGAFVCDPGNVLLAVDYGQIEMRVLAHCSDEEKLIEAIRQGLDVHNLTTSMIFSIPYEKVTKDMWQRDAAKTLGFGIVYGISAPALKTQIKLQSSRHTGSGVNVAIDQCQKWIDDYTQNAYPNVGHFMADSVAEARRFGYVEDMYGRRRYLPGVHSPIGKVRSEAERIATNHKIQAGAQSIIKMAMAEIWEDVLPRFRARGYCEPVMQIHDELVFECEEEMAEELKAEVERVMKGVVSLRVPMEADGKIAKRWSELK